MKKILMLAVLAVCSVSAFSQYNEDDEQTFKFGVGTGIAIPIGDLKESSSYGYGLEITGVYNFSESIAGFFQGGVHVFDDKSDFYGNGGILHVPILLGARFKAGGFFAGAGAGYGLWNAGDTPLKGFLYSPQVGYDFGHYQLMLDYTSTAVTGGTLSYFGLKAYRTF